MSALPPPFVVFSLPRSRSFWMSRFLSYGGFWCGHEEVAHLRSLDDVVSLLSVPWAGSCETALAVWWRLLRHYRPDARVAVVRRAVPEVIDSLMRTGQRFDLEVLKAHMRRRAAKLDQVAVRWPGVLVLDYADLATEQGCAALFEHCLPLRHDREWWARLAPVNLQIDVPALMRYWAAHKKQADKLVAVAKHKSLQLLQPPVRDAGDGITFHVEPFTWENFREAIPLFREHLVQTDQSPDDWARKNLPLLKHLGEIGALQVMIARSNGRMFGYLVSIVSPSLDSPDLTEAQHTIFFASPEIRNLGMRLQRAANEALRERGVGQIHMRTGNRGLGPKLGAYYRRLGAEEVGTLYRLGEAA